MFDSQYRFYGKHAQEVSLLTNVFDNVGKGKLFNRNLDVYINAPIIGFLYGRITDEDHTKSPETGKVYDQSIMGEQIIHSDDELMFNFRLIMLLDEAYEPDINKRIDKAFRNTDKDKSDESRFEGYVRGGVDVLYEKLIEGAKEPQDYVEKLCDFLEDFQERFNSNFTSEDVLKLCSN